MPRAPRIFLDGAGYDVEVRPGWGWAGPRGTAPEFRFRIRSCRKAQEADMPKFVIEREIPGAGKLSAEELRAISRKSCDVLREMGPEIQWLESYVTDDKLYCVYIAPSEGAVRDHAGKGGFPANRISRVARMIDPTTAE